MCLQQTILKQYREQFPSETLAVTSEKTGIQVTRIFRLFNGSTMKVNELEAFDSILNQNFNNNEFIKAAKECLGSLSQERLNNILIQMNHALKVMNFNQAVKPFSINTQLNALA